MKKFLGAVFILILIGLGISSDFRNLATKWLILGSIDNFGKLANSAGEILKNVKISSTAVQADATLDTLNRVNKYIAIEGQISNKVWIKQICKALFFGTEINIYSADPDIYNLSLIIDFSKVKEKKGKKYIVPADAIHWLITVPVEVKPHSKTNDKYYNVAKTLPMYILLGIMNKFPSLFRDAYIQVSTVSLVNGQLIELELPPLSEVPITMENGYSAKVSDFRPKYGDFIQMYYPGDEEYQEDVTFSVASPLQLRNILTTP